MPVRKVTTTKNGKPVVGYKWGQHGKTYTGVGAKARATSQGRAAFASGYKPKKK
jgi:hypothetical protein